jgi:hypothetical protein
MMNEYSLYIALYIALKTLRLLNYPAIEKEGTCDPGILLPVEN